jgi:ABC-2 type transport system ATP-binding protein
VLTIDVRPDLEERAATLLGGRGEGRGRVALAVRDGGAAVPRTLATLTAAGIEPLSVALARPTLDDVFRRVVGSHLIEQSEPQEVAA